MAKYIKASEVADELANRFKIPLQDMVDVFAKLKPADVAEVKHGKWLNEGLKCSACDCGVLCEGEQVDLSSMPYCPKCGARMDGNDE